ncbi:PLP-dependent aminotransferase family protein [Marinomonas sp. CT5]|uniref:aminotransferase-like domain-containing protein n=1 Tax=Marinomonas sp. CT5 TaxID=2066133 RepID=UPI0017D023F4|nr:PLP-dependent aminotransferase family protein [Marinomonas sp. CT5]NVK71956.1 PLP-dependent aminotransferase family protein [Oceanospirillaceae bacterium]QUX97382.1 PLP-dependent aminotransferase family protein [Marinomonas sp. CT5]
MDCPLYEKIANQIEHQVHEGIFLPGAKIPSVRKSSKQMEVSVATVLQAYSLLEDRGVIKARPQKGYFVQEIQPQVLEQAKIEPTQNDTSIHTLLRRLLHTSQNNHVIQFGAAIPKSQFLPIRQLQRSVGRLMRLEPEICAAYEFTPGSLSLRRQIAIRMLDSGCQLQPDDITITLGCQNALMLSLQAVATAGDTIAIESPAYHGVLQAIEVLNLKAVEIPCYAETGIDLDLLEKAAEEWQIKACIVTPNNQNPSGATLNHQARQRIIHQSLMHNFTIIEDDVYGELSYKDKHERSLKADDKNNSIIYCSSFSKSIAPGFRIGWIVGGQFQTKIEHYAYVQSLAIPTLTQTAIANFLENGAYDRHLRKTRLAYQDNLARCQALIQQHFPEGTTTSNPRGGFLLWVTLPSAVNAMLLHTQALEIGIGLLPGLAFSLTAQFSHHFRLNYALTWDNKTDAALKELGKLCYSQLHSSRAS